MNLYTFSTLETLWKTSQEICGNIMRTGKHAKVCKTKDFEDFRASMKNIGKNKRIG
jgi:hypothetical protein